MRNPVVEQWLQSEVVPFEYQVFLPWTAFDETRSRSVQSRLGARVIPEAVERYALAMMDGNEFPAVLAYQEKGSLVLLDGVQRMLAAREAERDGTDVYLVQTTNMATLELVARAANLIVGQTVSKGEAVLQAMTWHRLYGGTVKDAARRFRLRVGELENAIRHEVYRDRFGALGIDTSQIKPTNILLLGSITSDPVVRATIELVREADLRNDQIKDLVGQVRAATSEQAQFEVIARVRAREDIQERILHQRHDRPTVLRPKRRRTFALLEQLVRHLQRHPTLATLELHTEADVERLVTGVQTLTSLVQAVLTTRQEVAA